MASPFFSLQFIDAVQRARGDVEVAVLRDAERIVGFWPLHRIGGVAKPVGRFLNDAHNVVSSPNLQIDWRFLLKRCGVRGFDFHALVGDTSIVPDEMIRGVQESFAADLRGGGAASLRRMEASHRTMKKQDQKTRKMQRELGPLRLEFDCRDESVLQTAIDWKRQQYTRTHILDLFTLPWTRTFLSSLHGLDPAEDCRGVVSALWAGDELVATHIGMLQCNLLHYWFPAYNVDHAIYSPGTALFKSIVAASDSIGIDKIDMGYGAIPYKRKQTDVVTTVAKGCVTYSRWLRGQRALSSWVQQAAPRVPMKETVKRVVRSVMPDAGVGKIR